MKSGEGYYAVPNQDEESRSDVGSNPRQSSSTLHSSALRRCFPWVIHCSLFLLNVGVLVVSTNPSFYLPKCARETSWWSPALESVQSEYEQVRYAGLEVGDSVWRGKPTPEIDEAWDEVTGKTGEIPVSVEDAIRSGLTLNTDSLVRFPEKHGGQIYASVEWTHHLHCLNMIRKFVRFDYYKSKDPSFKARPYDETINHMDHCVDMLRQHIMCTADQGLIFSHWVKGRDHKHVDFNTQHKCRNFQKAFDWVKERSVLVKMSDLVRHEGVVDLPDFPENLTVHSNGYEGSYWYQP